MGQFQNIVFFALLIAAMYLLLIRPQQQQRKRRDEMMSALAPGDQVVTIGGIHGTVVEIYENVVLIQVFSGAQMEVSRAGIGQISQRVSELEAEEPLADEPVPDAAADGNITTED